MDIFQPSCFLWCVFSICNDFLCVFSLCYYFLPYILRINMVFFVDFFPYSFWRYIFCFYYFLLNLHILNLYWNLYFLGKLWRKSAFPNVSEIFHEPQYFHFWSSESSLICERSDILVNTISDIFLCLREGHFNISSTLNQKYPLTFYL